MNSEDLKTALTQKPFFVMFVDAQPNNNVSLLLFAQDQAYFEVETQNLNLRRNYLYLFDNLKNEVMKLDSTIGISLLERNEQEKLNSKLDRIHPFIPNAKIGEEDKATMQLQMFKSKDSGNSAQKKESSRVQVHFQENDDPNLIIAQNKQVNKEKKQLQLDQSKLNKSKNDDLILIDQPSSKSESIQEESSSRQSNDNEQYVQKLDRDHRYSINAKQKECSLQQMLDQPFCPPPMFYEKKAKPQPEKALILKQSAKLQKGNKSQQIQIVKEALNLQEERYLDQLDEKQKIIKHQQDMIARQHQLLQQQLEEQKQKTIEIEQKRQDKDYIQLNDIEKIRGLDPKDRLNVLEFLVKELIQLKALDVAGDSERSGKKRRRRHRRRRHSSSYDSEYDDEDDEVRSSQKKIKFQKEVSLNKNKNSNQKQKKSNLKSPASNSNRQKQIKVQDTEEDLVYKDEAGKLESISVDDNDQVVQSSRKEWEEELTSTQNLGVSVSMRNKNDTSLRVSQQKQYIEPTVKLNNFIAFDATKNTSVNRFTSIKETHQRKQSEITDEQNYDDNYDDDFESLSKSQAGLSVQLSVKKSLNKNTKNDDDSYSNEFESIGDSKTISNEATVICFMCKHQIPKSQALQHNKICTKVQIGGKGKKNSISKDDNPSIKHQRKYSPIREAEDEEAQSIKNSSKGSKKGGPGSSSGDNYSSYRYDESESVRGGKTSALVKKIGEERKSTDYMRESYMSSSMSTEKPGVALFSKQVTEYMKNSKKDKKDDEEEDDDSDEEDSDEEDDESASVGKIGSITQMYEKYKKMQDKLAKFNVGELEESATISKSN
ncbi:UNKNOWN [Stylonychia lemnae]|uniref:Uncharacterized protein n=1 Tax=Stylonychia lemnae TaxID=5949 RepID=A0A078AIT1_STYLE|nr:UNKNOWN [Stylonychia lemnae]|eukprot:CDW82200.1 UNKNOWN [Stylonychia lemnae]